MTSCARPSVGLEPKGEAGAGRARCEEPDAAPLSEPPVRSIHVEVVYALPERVWRVQVELPSGSTALQAFEASGLRMRIPGMAERALDLGVFSHPVAADRVLRDGDRVEVYRPLLIDPKDARRRRAAQG